MDINQIRGIIVPIITPFDKSDHINTQELRRQVNRMIDCGVHGIFCFGTNGEGYALNYEEKKQILETVIDETNHRVPVYAGTGCITTRDTIKESQMAQSVGADALSIITPSFAAASQNELLEHYVAVASQTDLPIILYNIPARTGNNLAAATVSRLAEVPNISGIKDSSGNFINLLSYFEAVREHPDFKILAGNDQLILWNLLAGGAGAIAGCANVFPRTLVGIYNSFCAGDMDSARAYQDAIQSFRATFRYGNPNTIIKCAVRLQGYDVGACRRPFDQVPDEGIRAIQKVLDENKRNHID